MSRNRRHGTASATTLLWVALCLVSFGVLSVWTVESRAGAIQADIERRAREAVRSAPGFDLRIEADGRDVALRGRVGSETDRDAVVSRLMVVEGIRVIEDDLKVIPGLRARRSARGGRGAPAASRAASPAPGDAPPDAWETNRSGKEPAETEDGTAAVRTQPATADRTAGDAVDATAASPAPPPDAHPTDEPDEDIPRPVEEADLPDQSELTFAAGSTALGADAQAAVARMAQRASDGGVVHVYGHADDAGTEWANHDLSLDRAGRVARALRGAGLPPGRIRVHGAGDQYPLGPVGSRRNRRVELALQDDVP